MAGTRVVLNPSGEIRVSLSADDFALAQQVGPAHRRVATSQSAGASGLSAA